MGNIVVEDIELLYENLAIQLYSIDSSWNYHLIRALIQEILFLKIRLDTPYDYIYFESSGKFKIKT